MKILCLILYFVAISIFWWMTNYSYRYIVKIDLANLSFKKHWFILWIYLWFKSVSGNYNFSLLMRLSVPIVLLDLFFIFLLIIFAENVCK